MGHLASRTLRVQIGLRWEFGPRRNVSLISPVLQETCNPSRNECPRMLKEAWSVQPWSLHYAQQGNLRKSLQNSYFKIHMTAMSQTKFFVQMPGFEFWNNSNSWRSCKQAEPDNRQNSLGHCWMHYLWGGKCKFYARFLLRYSLKTRGPTKSFLEFGSSTVHHMSHPSSLP